ncbi:hypothetical protein SHKM778_75800 [Streptomyces sp. KM77-8]|uniref:Mammalian cell entry C-terminal domain-containing protein n=1 Tax=Streptomyces haneummycinicus TaxID=3074435 RepID=A0AAT9HV21_9ACTN
MRPQGTTVRVGLRLDEGEGPRGRARRRRRAQRRRRPLCPAHPAYSEGPALADGAVLPAARNRLPVEIDQIYDSLTDLSDALGPDGANSEGALSDLLRTGADNLDGNGDAIGDSVEEFGKAARTLDGSSGDLFRTLGSLQTFTTMLKAKDTDVRTAQERLDEVVGFFADNKDDLTGALEELGKALGQVKTFIEDNRGELKDNVDRLVPSPAPWSSNAPRWPRRWTSPAGRGQHRGCLRPRHPQPRRPRQPQRDQHGRPAAAAARDRCRRRDEGGGR